MSVTIGIYEKEENVMEGIRLLSEAGVEQRELRIIVNNSEGAPLLTSNADIPVDELYGIQKAQSEESSETAILGGVPYATGVPFGVTSTSAGPIGVVLPRTDYDDAPSSEEVMNDIGIPSDVVEQCSRAVESGKYLLLVDSDTQTDVESLLRHSGASDVVGQQ